ncbi:AAA family ATPase [Streptomyces sp. LD120]|uniref:AAA family ATPase n=1 Tax=Streptomyces physcomitrii TaxID=2724184 RepID=A0ABX1H928_9ACTN|nr:AAA family ATPase [Streptomyces physcomitrii]
MFSRTLQGEVGVVLVEGAVGCGKTHALDAVTAHTAKAGALVLKAYGSSADRTELGTLRQLTDSPRLPKASAERLRHALAPADTPPTPPGGENSPQTTCAHLPGAREFRAALVELATREPVVICVDELHSVDPVSLQYLLHLASSSPTAKLLLVFAQATDTDHKDAVFTTELLRRPNFQRLRIERLTAEETARGLTTRLGLPSPLHLSCTWHDISGGNPLLLRALIDDYRTTPTANTSPAGSITDHATSGATGGAAGGATDSTTSGIAGHAAGSVTGDAADSTGSTAGNTAESRSGSAKGAAAGRASTTGRGGSAGSRGSAAGARVEPVVGDMFLQAVLTCIYRSGRTVSQIAAGIAVLGTGTTPELLARLLKTAPAATTRALTTLETAGLLKNLTFRHPAVQATVLENMDDDQRLDLHRRAATLLHQNGAPTLNVARHLLAAQDAHEPWAIPLLRDAAQQALAEDEAKLAVACLELACTTSHDPEEQAGLRLGIAGIMWRLNPSASERLLEEPLAALRTGTLPPTHIGRLGELLLAHGRIEEARSALGHLHPPTTPPTNTSVLTQFRMNTRWTQHTPTPQAPTPSTNNSSTPGTHQTWPDTPTTPPGTYETWQNTSSTPGTYETWQNTGASPHAHGAWPGMHGASPDAPTPPGTNNGTPDTHETPQDTNDTPAGGHRSWPGTNSTPSTDENPQDTNTSPNTHTTSPPGTYGSSPSTNPAPDERGAWQSTNPAPDGHAAPPNGHGAPSPGMHGPPPNGHGASSPGMHGPSPSTRSTPGTHEAEPDTHHTPGRPGTAPDGYEALPDANPTPGTHGTPPSTNPTPSGHGIPPGGPGTPPSGPGTSPDGRGIPPSGRTAPPNGRGTSPGGRGTSPGGRGTSSLGGRARAKKGSLSSITAVFSGFFGTGQQEESPLAAAEKVLELSPLTDATFEPLVTAVNTLLFAGRPDKAAPWCDALIDESRRRRAPGWRAVFASLRAETALRMGNLTESASYARTALEAVPGRDGSVFIGGPLAHQILAYTAMGKYDTAARHLSHPVPDALFRSVYALSYTRARGRYYLATGRTNAALGELLMTGKLAQRWDMDEPALLPWRTDAAEAWLHLGEHDKATTLLTQQLTKNNTDPRVKGTTLRLLAHTTTPHKKTRLLTQAIEQLQRSGDRLELARALADLAHTLHHTGDPTRATTLTHRAWHIAKECGAEQLAHHIHHPHNPHHHTETHHPTNTPHPTNPHPNTPHTPTPTTPPTLTPHNPPPPTPTTKLSQSETRVATLATHGHTNREIAATLYITISTVEQHLTRIYRKLHIQNRHQLPTALHPHTNKTA